MTVIKETCNKIEYNSLNLQKGFFHTNGFKQIFMKSKLLLLLVCILSSSVISAQTRQGFLSPDSQLLNANQKIKFGFQAGTSYSSFGNGFSLFSNQISPHLSYQVSPKFSIEIGTTISNYNTGNTPVFSLSGDPMTASFMGVSGYAVGRYLLSERLTISGSVYRESSVMPGLSVNPAAFEFLNQGMAVGFDYKISDKFSFGAGIQMRHTNNPWGGNYFNNPYQRSMLGRPDRFLDR